MASPAQIWARVIGFALVAAGIAGFFYSSAFDSPGHTAAVLGILDVNGWHNLVHILTGVFALAFAGSYAGARTFCLVLAAVYALVAIWGFAIGDGHAILSIVPVNTEDNFLHAFIAVVSLVVGVTTPAVPVPSAHGEGRGFRWN
ncbi:MAG: hypothetical protein QOF37_1166 [Thermoleophilaceae bacterium]|jgi:hypothetical protein|nr:hypothetical protein [Thermoleophilaceae bacterium]